MSLRGSLALNGVELISPNAAWTAAWFWWKISEPRVEERAHLYCL